MRGSTATHVQGLHSSSILVITEERTVTVIRALRFISAARELRHISVHDDVTHGFKLLRWEHLSEEISIVISGADISL